MEPSAIVRALSQIFQEFDVVPANARSGALPLEVNCGAFQLSCDLVPNRHEFIGATATWLGQLPAQLYVEALSVANSLNREHPWPAVSLVPERNKDLLDVLHDDAGVLNAQAQIVHPLPVDEGQWRSFAASAVASGVVLSQAFSDAFPDYESGQPLHTVITPGPVYFPGVTRDRVRQWFSERGFPDIPFNEEDECFNLSLHNSPVDIVLRNSEVFEVRVAAALPGQGSGSGEADPATAVHVANRLHSLAPLARASVVQEDHRWWVVSSCAVPLGAGVNDYQLDLLVHQGIMQSATLLRAIMHRVQ
ncbi:hypothetical protein GP475_05185 [Corynebacterium poyangense]|uniref:Uncharacterized protein n=1 Tax=Corynebacterium poyangense TaxID=2684405 RepID=A0A7H0SNI1_9CORY|nr:hypothetical protein [Corynebacterium poyangense]MBZ8177138.1 hypothetical protein [Corynebacterium poyangense]QNQ90106.1 hypothetical protein GP475_05185 [Corynebacterium poyangense]